MKKLITFAFITALSMSVYAQAEVKEVCKDKKDSKGAVVKDKTGKVVTDEKGVARVRHIVHIKTYVSLMGDILMFTWDNDEVSFYTKLNHSELPNWGGKMFWKIE